MSAATRQLARSIRRAAHDVSDRKPETQIAVVRRVDPVEAELTTSRQKLTEDDLEFGQGVRRYDRDTGIAKGDALVVCPMRNGDWFVVEIVGEGDPKGNEEVEEAAEATAKKLVEEATATEATEWKAPTLAGTWANYEANGAYAPVAYRKLPSGLVLIRGLVKNASAFNPSSTIFTLPVGFRPSKNLIFSMWGSFNGSTAVFNVRVDVNSGGTVIVWGSPTTTDYLTLTLSFYPD